MWSDIETSKDLLGYSIHASLLKDVVTNPKNLPITVGLYGDWGSGKSSILKILQEQLEKDDNTVVVYFDGWSFESFDDAKMSLIQGIVDALENNEKFFAKVKDDTEGAFEAVKEAFAGLKKSITWMRALKVTTKAALPVVSAVMTGGVSIIPTLISAFRENKEYLVDLLTGDKAEEFLQNAINSENDEKKYKAVREFRTDFEALINKSKQGQIVILIDDLDRCLPRHIIDNLEAIKLFLNVPKTAFVIAADQYIVSNAIKSEYKTLIEASKEDRPHDNLGEAYMEKFIQLPYTLPKLSPKEVETYVTLLFCQSILDESNFLKIQEDFALFVSQNKFEKYGWDKIKNVLSGDNTHDLSSTIGFVSHFATIIGNSLRWNPRLIKRFLNAFEVRFSLLSRSGLNNEKNRFALLKLMLIEQNSLDRFIQLNSWTMSSHDTPKEILALEAIVDAGNKDFGEYKEWNSLELKQIFASEPKFSQVDMRELFWVSRDNLVDQMSGVALIPPHVKNVFNKIYNADSDSIRKNMCKTEITGLSSEGIKDIFTLLDAKLLTSVMDKNAYGVYYYCILNDIAGAYESFLEILSRIDTSKIPFSLGSKFKDILDKYGSDKKLITLIERNNRLMNSIKS